MIFKVWFRRKLGAIAAKSDAVVQNQHPNALTNQVLRGAKGVKIVWNSWNVLKLCIWMLLHCFCCKRLMISDRNLSACVISVCNLISCIRSQFHCSRSLVWIKNAHIHTYPVHVFPISKLKSNYAGSSAWLVNLQWGFFIYCLFG